MQQLVLIWEKFEMQTFLSQLCQFMNILEVNLILSLSDSKVFVWKLDYCINWIRKSTTKYTSHSFQKVEYQAVRKGVVCNHEKGNKGQLYLCCIYKENVVRIVYTFSGCKIFPRSQWHQGPHNADPMRTSSRVIAGIYHLSKLKNLQ